MSEDNPKKPDESSADANEMAGYLGVYVEETEEELDAVASALVELENNVQNPPLINEVFRLVHSMKGSSGMMGLTTISGLAHRWEDLLDRVRAGEIDLTQKHVDVMLRCVDAVRGFTRRLQTGGALQDATPEETQELVDQLTQLLTAGSDSPATPDESGESSGISAQFVSMKLAIQFDDRLQLPDLKAKLIVSRLTDLAEIISVDPDLEDAHAVEESRRVTVALLTQHEQQKIRSAANLEGVESLEFLPVSGNQTLAVSQSELFDTQAPIAKQDVAVTQLPPDDDEPAPSESAPSESIATSEPATATGGARQVAETVRVDIDRLDELVNLTGELIVNRERFQQLTRDLSSSLKRKEAAGRLLDLADRLETKLSADSQSDQVVGNGRPSGGASQELQQEADWLRECAAQWTGAAKQFASVADAVDQLSRISDSLQRSVMATRMVPLAPLFNRFKRVVRDLSSGTDKKIRLAIRGEKTELDKRMIDELSDPLIHLVRNAIDHGLETPDERRQTGKDPTGVIALEALHRGNSVYVTIKDDGRGIDVDRLRRRIVERGLASDEAAANLTESQVLEFIWRPGFSTAEVITDISGRGVGMDIVRNRISDLCGTIDVDTAPGESCTFTIRLPLTLAIIPSLLVRVGENTFSMPLEEVTEIAEVTSKQIVSVEGRRAVEIRDRFLPMVSLDEAFDWHGRSEPRESGVETTALTLIVLDVGGKPAALEVDCPLGASALVIKSLSDNFRAMPGLTGASVLGDGDICLMLDSAAVIELAKKRTPPK